MKNPLMISEGYANSSLQIGLGGIHFHGALIQADSYNLHVSARGYRHMIQAIKGDFLTATIPVHSHSLRVVRLIWAELAKRSASFTYAYPQTEREWLASL